MFTGYLKPMYGSLSTLLLETSTTDFYDVSRLYIEAFDKGEVYDSAADDERL